MCLCDGSVIRSLIRFYFRICTDAHARITASWKCGNNSLLIAPSPINAPSIDTTTPIYTRYQQDICANSQTMTTACATTDFIRKLLP